MGERYITVAIHTYERAVALRNLLEREGISVEFRNVNIEHPVISSGIRIRIREKDLPLALRVIESNETMSQIQGNTNIADPTKTIVVPVDFSDKSYNATIFAFGLAAEQKASIQLLHTYIDPYVAGSLQLTDSMTYELTDSDSREQIRKSAKAQMRHMLDRLKDDPRLEEYADIKVNTSIVEGVPEDAIADYARNEHPLIIVMGTRGPESKEIDMIGSVTAEVLDKCRYPVLALPEGLVSMSVTKDDSCQISTKFKNILCFCNIDQQDILALDALYRLFPGQDTRVTLVTMSPKRRSFVKSATDGIFAILDYCKTNFADYRFETASISRDNAIENIRSIERDTPFDLIVVPNKKKSMLTRIFSPTLAHKILFITKRPMLVVPV